FAMQNSYSRRYQLAWYLIPLLAGCGVQRTMTVESNPTGALVYLNGNEAGRTPLTRDFLWYGNYDVELRKEGFETVKTTTWVNAPWWQIPPIDLVAEILPVKMVDRKRLRYSMISASTRPAE